jgi:hypothetical protein
MTFSHMYVIYIDHIHHLTLLTLLPSSSAPLPFPKIPPFYFHVFLIKVLNMRENMPYVPLSLA